MYGIGSVPTKKSVLKHGKFVMAGQTVLAEETR